ncbi:MAG: DUF885 domain-containing protein, partial [Candidatus Eisenbacteria bacterium]
MSRRLRRTLGRAAVVVAVAALVWLVPTLWFRPWQIDMFYARVFVGYLFRHPQLMSQLGLGDGTALDFHSGRLDDWSPAGERADEQQAARELRVLRGYARGRMSAETRLSADVLDWYLDDQVRQQERFPDHDYPLEQLQGFQIDLPNFMLNLHPLDNALEARRYLERVSRFGTAVDGTIERLKERETRGVYPPRWVLDRSLVEMRDFRNHPAAESPLVVSFTRRTAKTAGLDSTERARLTTELTRLVTTVVDPAWDRLIAATEHARDRARDTDGVWALPDGDDYYAWCLRHYTTTDLSPDSVHALGLSEVARIQPLLRSLLDREGIHEPDFARAMHALRDQSRFRYPPGDSGRALILADYQAILDDASARCDTLFDVRPRARLEVHRMPEFRESGAAGAYYEDGSLDGKRPGVFSANLRDPRETSRTDMRTLAYHEGIPGHHFQVSIAQELKGVPFFRRVIPFTAYVEGWALYAEHLALEEGFHPTAADSIGALQAELFRATRLVVDTGIHRKRWPRERAIVYMLANTGMDSTEVVSEVERYVVWPGQACAYKVGELEIVALRERARAELGDRFDLKRFHDVVLTHGALPLTLLERVVDDWIAAERRA